MKYLKYIGKGAIPGIPARDLTEEETKKYGGEKLLIESGLWQVYKASNPKTTEVKKDGK